MPARDVVATALAAPIDWVRFEELVYSVLVADDLPRLRKLGNRADQGVDAQEETFYDGQRRVSTIVQVSSKRAQKDKVRETIATLRANQLPCTHLIFVTRHPVTSTNRRDIIEEAADMDVVLDIRDDQYLIAQLSKNGSPIFARFFGSIEEQLASLLDRPDPLQVAGTRLKHALLASLGAYVFSPRARLARGTLFQKTVLAAIAAAGGRAQPQDLLGAVRALLPGEAVDNERLVAAIGDLQGQGLCARENDEIVCRPQVMEQFVSVSRATENGYLALIEHVVDECRRRQPLDDAQLGYIERNIRRAVLLLLRAAGPLPDVTGLADAAGPLAPDVRSTVVRDLPTEVGQGALTALSDFVQTQDNVRLLAPLVRAYAALAIRNIDPLGRRWQQAVLSRSSLALDTDAVLHLLVEDLPEHKPLLTAVRALQAQGVNLLVSPQVIEEAVLHVERADRTFRRFAHTLLRLPEASVDGEVWHAVVRGYYYASKNGYTGSPESYWNQYYDAKNPARFIRHVLGQRVRLDEHDFETIPAAWESDSQELEVAVVEVKERSRWKAPFRDDAEMQRRVRFDVRMILHLAVPPNASLAAGARGYLASEDRGFVLIERHRAWRDRGNVLIITRALPELAAFVCGATIEDDEWCACFLTQPLR